MYIVTWIDKEHFQIFQVGSKIKHNKTGSRCNYWMSLGASQHLGLQRFAIGVNCWIPVVGCCFLVPHGLIVVFLRSSLLVRVAAVAPITLKVPAKIAKNTKNIKHEVKCTSFPMVQRTQHMYFQCVLDVNQSPQSTPNISKLPIKMMKNHEISSFQTSSLVAPLGPPSAHVGAVRPEPRLGWMGLAMWGTTMLQPLKSTKKTPKTHIMIEQWKHFLELGLFESLWLFWQTYLWI